MNMHDDRVIRSLEALATTAPDGLLGAVLTEIDLADRFTRLDGPAGPLYVAWNSRGVSGVAPAADEAEFAAIHEERVGRRAVSGGELPARLRGAVARALETGKPGGLPIDLSGVTPFQRAVLETTARIPRGEVRSYGWVAREMGRERAVRAVGSALNRNPVPVLIPCHRVGRSDGTLGDYAFGPEMKRALLQAEGLDVAALEEEAERGVRLVGSDTTHIFCVPTCHRARRITDPHRVEFHDEAGARTAGYRPCKVCRPAAA